MANKVELLKAICENPGWVPPQPTPGNIERALEELQVGGWVISRIDGWEATPRALVAYPNFYLDEEGNLHGAPTAAPPERDESGRPIDPVPQADGWDTMFKLPPILVSDHQRVETAIDHAIVKGSVTVVNTAQHRDRQEVEITVRIRGVSPA